MTKISKRYLHRARNAGVLSESIDSGRSSLSNANSGFSLGTTDRSDVESELSTRRFRWWKYQDDISTLGETRAC